MKNIAQFCLTLSIVAMSSALPASAQVAASIEGPISANLDLGSGKCSLTVMGMTVNIDTTEGDVINSPSARLTCASLTNSSSLPGRSQAGFIGGTAIVTGTESGVGVINAEDVFVEPAENVVVGSLTAGATRIVNTPLVSLGNDNRIPANIINAYGFKVDQAAIPAGALAGVEGYFADGKLYFHTLEVDAPIPPAINPTVAQVAVLRAQCDPGGRLEIRGGAYGPSGIAGNTIRVFRPNGTSLGTTNAAVDDPLFPQFGLYRFRTGINNCPAEVDVSMTLNGVTTPRVRVAL
jgi:hypothetical protein